MEYDLLPHTRLLCSTFPKTGRLERGVLRLQLALLGVSLVATPLCVWCGSRDCFVFFELLQPLFWLALLVVLLAPLALFCTPLSIGVRRGGGGVGDGNHSEHSSAASGRDCSAHARRLWRFISSSHSRTRIRSVSSLN